MELKNKEAFATTVAWMIVVVMSLALLFVIFFLWQWAKVYSANQTGAAELARATQNRQIAKLDADAQIERARGVAESNKIVADGLGGPEGYLRFLAIEAMKEQRGAVIYVPTEAGIPITEATRFNHVPNLTE